MEEIVKRLHEQRRIEQAKSLLESEGYRVSEAYTYKCYALVDYESGDSGMESDTFDILDVVKAGDEGEAQRYFKSMRGRFPNSYVTEISEEAFDEFIDQRDSYDGEDDYYESKNMRESKVSEATAKRTVYAVEYYESKIGKWVRYYTSSNLEDSKKHIGDYIFGDPQKRLSQYSVEGVRKPKYKFVKVVNESKKMRESKLIKKKFPTEQEAWDYAREEGIEVVKTQDMGSDYIAWFRKLDYKPEQAREELPKDEK